ncbi:hypothetical protein CHS0354_024216 [Potamilus streckersoni]|uniref:Ribosomal RNA-processing protein 14/surfeit locus protein 6 C-terminal domain-containing protein n=1 Tax=Potamilus streckersoni TaxID=2493646 RepID=A0AAE0RYF7_9BIVA|nr:hypothetical protein CHS0354_024216 [Potamilus streckersoni]
MSNASSLTASIKEDNAFFTHMLDTIPPDLYFDSDTKQKIREVKAVSDSDESKDGKGVENKKKFNSKKVSDPFKSKTVSQIQEELIDGESPMMTKIKEKKKNKKKDKKDRKEIKSAQDNFEILQEKLRARIEELQAKRNLNADEKQEKKRLRRKQSKLKLKMRLKAEKQKKNQNLKGGNNAEGTHKDSVHSNISQGKRPIYNKEGKLVFSKFDFSDSKVKEKSQSGLTGKDYKRLLEKIEKRNKTINKLKEKDTSAAKNMEEKLQWQAAIHRAEGEKVKDNPELLKKALKRKDKMKEKRKKKWDERVQQTKQRMDAKQQKRQKNIKSRKQAKIEKKIKKAKKRGRIIPGF